MWRHRVHIPGIHVWDTSYRHVSRAPVRATFRRDHGNASRPEITRRARPGQPYDDADCSVDTMQLADEDEIRFGASRTRPTPSVSPVESAARATRSSPRERNMRRNRGPVRHVAIRCRANDSSSHKRPRSVPRRVRPVRLHVDRIPCEPTGNRSPHAWLPVRHDSSPLVGDDVRGQRRQLPHKVNASIGIRSRLRSGITRTVACANAPAHVIVPTSRTSLEPVRRGRPHVRRCEHLTAFPSGARILCGRVAPMVYPSEGHLVGELLQELSTSDGENIRDSKPIR